MTDVDVKGLLDPELGPILGAFELPQMDADAVAAIRSAPFPAPALSGCRDPHRPRPTRRADGFGAGAPGQGPVRSAAPASTRFTAVATSSAAMPWTMPSSDQLCPALELVGVSVEYRLAPETPYPGPLEDCYGGLRWTYEHAEELGIDRSRIGIRGISAGGGLAAALALLARDRGEVPLAFQLLDCPMLDDRQLSTRARWRDYRSGAAIEHTAGGPTSAICTGRRLPTPRRRGHDLASLPPASSSSAPRRVPRRGRRLRPRLNHAGVDSSCTSLRGCHTRTCWRRTRPP